MEEQVFEVTLQVSSQSGHYFLRVDAEGLALIIRDAIRSRIPSIIFPTAFKVTVKNRDESASASGEIGRYVPEQCDEALDELVVNPRYLFERTGSMGVK